MLWFQTLTIDAKTEKLMQSNEFFSEFLLAITKLGCEAFVQLWDHAKPEGMEWAKYDIAVVSHLHKLITRA